MKKYSKQRELIVDIVKKNSCHPSAQYVYDEARKTMPHISLCTVYRNLKLLAAEGEMLSLRPGDGLEHFDGATTSHSHFYCEKCDKIFDLFELDIRNISSSVENQLGCQVITDGLIFNGICGDCLKNTL